MVTSGRAPRAVCARHGLPTVESREVKLYSTTPPWVWLLIPLGLLVAVIVAAALRKTVEAPLWPFCARCHDRRKQMLVPVWGARAAMLVGVGLAVVTSSPEWLMLPMFAFLPFAVFSGQAAWSTIAGARVTRDGNAVEVRDPAAAYVASLPAHPGAVAQPAFPLPQAPGWG
jgi:hypothetical protein